MQIRELFLVVFLSVLLLTNCSFFNKQECPSRTFLLPRVKNHFVPCISWSIPIGKRTVSAYSNLHPAYINDNRIVYAANHDGIVKAINAKNGERIWEVNLSKKNRWFSHASASLSGGVTACNNRVYVGSEKGKVYAINNRDGSVEWKTSVTGEVFSRPIVSDGLVLVHTSNGQLQALNEENGEVKWTLELEIPIRSFSLRSESTPSSTGGIAIIGDKNGRVSAVLVQEGQLLWKQRISYPVGKRELDKLTDVDATPVIIGNVVYAIAYNGNLAALDLYDGRIIWECKIGSANDFIVDRNCIYLSDQSGRILAINRYSGVIFWKRILSNCFLTAPALYKNMLVVGDQSGYIYWINPISGRCITRKKINISGFMSNPIVANDKILIQTKNGILYAITS